MIILVILTAFYLVKFLNIPINVGQFVHLTDAYIVIFLAAMVLIFWILRETLFDLSIDFLRDKANSVLKLAIILILTSGILSALIDEVDAIILPVLLVFYLREKGVLNNKEVYKLIILSILAANAGSLLLQIGNPVSLIFGEHMHISPIKHMIVMFPVGIIELLLVAWFAYMYLEDRQLDLHKIPKRKVDKIF